MFGKNINRRIADSIGASTSFDAVAGYLQQLKDSMWPGGEAAAASSERSQDCKVRTRLEAKLKLFSALPEQLKTLIGQNVAKNGILR